MKQEYLICQADKMVCMRCGQSHAVQMPSPIPIWLATAKWFSRAHRGCGTRDTGKPKQPRRKPDTVKVYPDGREVCAATPAGVREYQDRTRKMWARQGNKCGLQVSDLCLGRSWLSPSAATFDHEDGRGMNGSHRDDRIEKDGKPYNCAACSRCNAEKGSRRLEGESA